MDDHDPLVDRLRDLGGQPVDPAVASRHFGAMAAAPGGGHGGSWTRVKIGAAFLVGLLVGGTGLASAGALPGPAQDAAHTTLAKVGVKVPQGTERFNDPAVCGTDPATQQPFRNHGQYVKANKGNPAAAQSRCGKPLKAGTEPDEKAGTPTDPATDPAAGGNDKRGTDGGTPKDGNGNGNGKPGKAKGKTGDGSKGSGEPTEPKGTAPASPGKSDERGPATAPTTSGSTSTSSTSSSVVKPKP